MWNIRNRREDHRVRERKLKGKSSEREILNYRKQTERWWGVGRLGDGVIEWWVLSKTYDMMSTGTYMQLIKY